MTEDTTITTQAEPAEAPDAAHEVVAADAGAPVERVKWHARNNAGQTNFDRYLAPLLTPLIAVAIIIFYVLNLSRVLLSGKSTIAIIVAVVVTVAILSASSGLSNAPRMRSQSLAVFAAVSLVVLMFAGFVSVGHAQEKKEAAAVACTPIARHLKIPVTNAIKLQPAFTVKGGCVEIDYTGPDGFHTLEFIGQTVPAGPLLKSGSGPDSKFAFMLAPGTYKVHCTVSGHEAMVSTITVTA